MNKKLLSTAILALCFGGTGNAFASDTITIDFDGTAAGNGDVEVKSIDWTVGNALSLQATPTENDATGQTTSGTEGEVGYSVTTSFEFDTQVYFQAELGTYLYGGPNTGVKPFPGDAVKPSGSGTTYEWTVVAGVNETANIDVTQTLVDVGSSSDADPNTGGIGGNDDVYVISTSAAFSLSSDQPDNFYTIYYDAPADSYSLEGTGFADGTAILKGTVTSLIGDFAAAELIKFVDLDDSGDFSSGDQILTAYAPLDGSTPDNWSNATLAYLSIDATGATDFDVDVSYADGNFFKDEITKLTQDLFFNTSNIVPYDEQDPSRRFTTGDGTVLVNCTDFFLSDDGTCTPGTEENPNAIINGLGESILLQSDANTSFVLTTPVPEPSLLALLGMSGIGLFGLAGMRNRKQAR